jgi:hypothetical protein
MSDGLERERETECDGSPVGSGQWGMQEPKHDLISYSLSMALKPVLRIRIRIRIRIHRTHMFLGLPDPDPLVRGMDPDPDPSINMQK